MESKVVEWTFMKSEGLGMGICLLQPVSEALPGTNNRLLPPIDKEKFPKGLHLFK